MKSSALVISILLLCTGGFSATAEQPTIADALNSSGSVAVIQPDALNRRLVFKLSASSETDNSIAENSAPKIRAGYRVQVFDDNNVRSAKHDAQVRKQQIETRFPEYPVYITFNSPYWRVKVGDFKNRVEAEAAMAEIRHAFPAMAKSLRIVRDRINH